MFKKMSFSTLGSAFLLFALSTVAFAEGGETAIAGLRYFTVSVFAAGFGIAVAAFGGALGQGRRAGMPIPRDRLDSTYPDEPGGASHSCPGGTRRE